VVSFPFWFAIFQAVWHFCVAIFSESETKGSKIKLVSKTKNKYKARVQNERDAILCT